MGWARDTARVADNVGRSFNRGATYTPAGAGAIALLKSPFDAEFVSVEISDGVAIESKRPVLSVLKDEIDPVVPAQGDQAVIDGITYTVKEVRPDSEGQMYELDLFRA